MGAVCSFFAGAGGLIWRVLSAKDKEQERAPSPALDLKLPSHCQAMEFFNWTSQRVPNICINLGKSFQQSGINLSTIIISMSIQFSLSPSPLSPSPSGLSSSPSLSLLPSYPLTFLSPSLPLPEHLFSFLLKVSHTNTPPFPIVSGSYHHDSKPETPGSAGGDDQWEKDRS